MNRYAIRETLEKAGVDFAEWPTMSNGFHGTRFTFHKRELKKVDKTDLKSYIQAYFKEWCIEIF
jgi:hypothetical protein